MKKIPAEPAKYYNRIDVMRDLCAKDAPAFLILLNARLLAMAWHGGYWKTAWHFLREGTFLWLQSIHIHTAMWVSDRLGWTHLRPLQDNPKVFIRHGKDCDCKDDLGESECLENAIPNWYKKLTRIDP